METGTKAVPSVPLLTREAAKILECSSDLVRHLDRIGRLHAQRTAGGVRLYDRHEVERVARERREKSERRESI